MNQNQTESKPQDVEEPREEGLDETPCSANFVDAMRYRKLRNWMSSNVREGWSEVENLGGIACYVSWDEFDAYLDALPECNVGLCYKRPPQEPSQQNAKAMASPPITTTDPDHE